MRPLHSKNPGALAGATGADRGHKLSGSGQGKAYIETPSAARIAWLEVAYV